MKWTKTTLYTLHNLCGCKSLEPQAWRTRYVSPLMVIVATTSQWWCWEDVCRILSKFFLSQVRPLTDVFLLHRRRPEMSLMLTFTGLVLMTLSLACLAWLVTPAVSVAWPSPWWCCVSLKCSVMASKSYGSSTSLTLSGPYSRFYYTGR